MAGSLDALGGAWRLLGAALDGPLHPGGTDATAALLDRAGVTGGTRLLDVGCGAGEALSLARERGADAVGLDRRPGTAGAVAGDLTALPFRGGSVDVVLGECVLCLADLDRALAEGRRVLRPGGRLALSDVTVEGTPPELPPPVDELLCLEGAREREALLDRIGAAGFDVEDVRTHREEVLAMRDRLRDAVDHERLGRLLGDDEGNRLREAAADLEAAVEAGRVGYVSVVATVPDGNENGGAR